MISCVALDAFHWVDGHGAKGCRGGATSGNAYIYIYEEQILQISLWTCRVGVCSITGVLVGGIFIKQYNEAEG